jgi:hypothetical protein
MHLLRVFVRLAGQQLGMSGWISPVATSAHYDCCTCLQARGNVESWLTSVENAMRASVRALAKRGMKEYPVTPRTEWVLQNPAQLVIVVSQIYWCQVGGCWNMTAQNLGSTTSVLPATLS